MPGTIDWYYHRKGCNTCSRMDEFLALRGYAAAEIVNASKQPILPPEALRIAQGVDRILAAKGKKIVELNVKRDGVTSEDVAANLIGPSGKLRAPTVRRGRTLLVGFHPESFDEALP
ncbi:MAG: hypothetical protein KF774_06695 [Planctomyces sp.]|nr:hypothetical protein [Planctomyces sp.]